jgi:hypothetical protein
MNNRDSVQLATPDANAALIRRGYEASARGDIPTILTLGRRYLLACSRTWAALTRLPRARRGAGLLWKVHGAVHI